MSAIIFVALVAFAAGSPTYQRMSAPDRVVFTPAPLPSKWSASRVDLSAVTTCYIALQRQNLDHLSEIVQRVSNPHSSDKPLSTDEVNELTKPAQAALETAEEWLASSELSFSLMATGDRFEVTGTYAQLAHFFSTSFARYSDGEGRSLVRASEFSLPAHVAEHVSAVFGLHGLPLFSQDRPVSTGLMPVPVTPDVIEKTYNVSGVTVTRSTKNRQAVAEFQGQLMSESDLKTFFKQYVPNAKPGDDEVYRYVGYNATGEGVEALLDIQYIMGVAPGIKTEFWEFKNMDFCSDLQSWTTTLLSTTDIPLVHSISYGWQGDVSQIGCTKEEVQTVDVDFQKLAAQGITIIFASGDSGSGYTPHFLKKPVLYPSWPASSPWVTAVGATMFLNNQPGTGEQAVMRFGSGGGFSTMFDAPNYQSAFTSKYLANAPDLPPAKSYPAGGRGTPDVAALGDGYQVIVNGVAQTVGGTSASAPAFAALVSLLNEARFAKNLKPIGFLNNWIYANPQIFYDVTVGDDRVTRQGGKAKYGFSCTKGWDPVTGMGTPLFGKMLASVVGEQ